MGLLCVLATVAQGATGQSLMTEIERAPVFWNRLIRSTDREPTVEEAQSLWNAIENLKRDGAVRGIDSLESFIKGYPDSPWTPSLRANLAKHYRDRGYYTLAMEHWEAAWHATKTAKSGGAKQVADFTLAHWMSLQSMLGRKEELSLLVTQTSGLCSRCSSG